MKISEFNKVFITGCDTGVGKTIVSAILVQAFNADYWKPVQSGALEDSDSLTVSRLITTPDTTIHPESYLLEEPLSPHAAAARAGVEISIDAIQIPETKNFLVIEGAGGVLVPLNREHTIADLIRKFDAPAIVVSRHYLGSINHTLLTLTTLKSCNIPVLGVVFVGDPNGESETAIVNMGKTRMLGRVAWEEAITPIVVSQYARLFREVL